MKKITMMMTFGIRDLSEWPVGPGQLTARGKRMHYHLGQVTFIIMIIIMVMVAMRKMMNHHPHLSLIRSSEVLPAPSSLCSPVRPKPSMVTAMTDFGATMVAVRIQITTTITQLTTAINNNNNSCNNSSSSQQIPFSFWINLLNG